MSSPNITILDHPAIEAKIGLLRDRSLRSSVVRSLTHELSQIVSIEATRSLPHDTPKIALIIVLRAGLPMCEPFLATLSPEIDVVVYHLGLYREKKTLEPVEYYNKLPSQGAPVERVFVVDPLIATGGTATATIDILRQWGAKKITFLSILASPQGAQAVAETWPEGVELIVAHLDEGVDAKGYITPGIGDIGDRLYGTAL
ncbi:uracil phosphoribosyltransferase [Delphinella strobiligena]|nr:uracil phosphoribosyltransferase [Delphinella strobiligena]